MPKFNFLPDQSLDRDEFVSNEELFKLITGDLSSERAKELRKIVDEDPFYSDVLDGLIVLHDQEGTNAEAMLDSFQLDEEAIFGDDSYEEDNLLAGTDDEYSIANERGTSVSKQGFEYSQKNKIHNTELAAIRDIRKIKVQYIQELLKLKKAAAIFEEELRAVKDLRAELEEKRKAANSISVVVKFPRKKKLVHGGYLGYIDRHSHSMNTGCEISTSDVLNAAFEQKQNQVVQDLLDALTSFHNINE